MDKTREILLSSSLKAEELLRSKGIRDCMLEEWERSLQALPKTGKKHFEPNNSWLENVQIEKGLKTHKDLLNTERVNRLSELASAEWIPEQKKALVTKKSGQDWNNFGLQKNGSLYLIPEEALFLLETNCLELTWNGVPCSLQQAYEILIDDSVCTLNEYRVYSQLIRYGYRIQRYIYEDLDKSNRPDEPTPVKRKVIVNPENGLRLSDSQTQQVTEKSTETSVENASQTLDKTLVNSSTKDCQSATMEKPIEHMMCDIMDQILCNVEDRANVNSSAGSKVADTNDKQSSNMNGEEKSRNSKLEIISDETLLGNIKIVSDSTCNSTKKTVATSKWPGTRIQRNVKLLPKRSDKTPHVDVIDSGCTGGRSRGYMGKRRTLVSSPTDESMDLKKSKHEVIELSDDEIQELPRPMTRMEMLNLFPNIASQSGNVTQKVSKRYIPHNVRPQRNVYQYNQAMIQQMQANDRKMREVKRSAETNKKQNTFRSNSTSSTSPNIDNNSRSVALQHQHVRSPLCGQRPLFQRLDQIHRMNFGFPFAFPRFPFNYNQAAYALQNRITLMHQNVFHNTLVAFENHGNGVQQSRSLTIQMNNFAMPFMGTFRPRHPFMENQCRHAVYHNFMWQQRFLQRRTTENALAVTHGNSNPVTRRVVDGGHDGANRPSFTTRAGAGSWKELKKKWCEEKTITIDDEDYKSRYEHGEEVQVVELINPLVGPKCASSLAEIYSRLSIIKSAPEKMVRRKKSRYKISYNVYSCAHHYRKTNPGQPLYNIVVIRKEDSFLQPIELNRLQQDAKGSQIILACVSMSISYIQPGIITVPNVN